MNLMKSVTLSLIAIIFAVFILQLIIPGFTEHFYFDPSLAMTHLYMFVTSIFLHGGIMHILLNLYALFLFGMIAESKITKKEYLLVFFGAGIFGNFVYYMAVVLNLTPAIPALGASGAIYGIMGLVGVLFPDLVLFLFFFPMKMKYAVALWFITEFVGTFNMVGIAHAAHFGGLIFGIVAGLLIKENLKRRIGSTQNYGNVYMVSHNKVNNINEGAGVSRKYKLPWE